MSVLLTTAHQPLGEQCESSPSRGRGLALDRLFHRERACAEIVAAARANADAAGAAHAGLADLHMQRCRSLTNGQISDCEECVLVAICDTFEQRALCPGPEANTNFIDA